MEYRTHAFWMKRETSKKCCPWWGAVYSPARGEPLVKDLHPIQSEAAFISAASGSSDHAVRTGGLMCWENSQRTQRKKRDWGQVKSRIYRCRCLFIHTTEPFPRVQAQCRA